MISSINESNAFNNSYFTAGCQWRTSPKTLKTLIFAASVLIFWTVPLNADGLPHVTKTAGLMGLQLVAASIIKVAHKHIMRESGM